MSVYAMLLSEENIWSRSEPVFIAASEVQISILDCALLHFSDLNLLKH